MSSPYATLEQTRALLKNDKLSHEQIETLARNGGLCGELPDPTGCDGGEPYWSREAFLIWSETAKRSRGGPLEISTRGATLIDRILRREKQQKVEQAQSLDDLAASIALGVIDTAEAERQLMHFGVSGAVLKPIVDRITNRQELARQRNDAIAARDEVNRFQTEIDTVAGEIEAYRLPRLQKIQRLNELKQAAQRKWQQIDSFERALRNTLPQELKAAIAETNSEIAALRDRPGYLRGQVLDLESRIASLEEELESLQRQIRQLAPQPNGDFEAAEWLKALREKESHLLADLSRSRKAVKAVRTEISQFANRGQSLREKLARLEAAQFDIVPKVADLI